MYPKSGFGIGAIKKVKQRIYVASTAGMVGLAISGCVNDCSVTAGFSASPTTVYAGDTVVFTDFTVGDYGTGSWHFSGGSPEFPEWAGRGSTVSVIYNTPGTYAVSLLVSERTDDCSGNELDLPGYITVLPLPSDGCEGITSVTDADGNTYNVIEIGSQCWMQENLKTTRYKDGGSISGNLDDATWESISFGAYAIFDNISANDLTYGKLYNFFALAGGKLCPEGWHIPSQAEWQLLVDHVGADANAFKATTNWLAAGATNSSGFSALPGSLRAYYGTFGFTSAGLGEYAGFWTSTSNAGGEGEDFGSMWYISIGDPFVQTTTLDKNTGLSCRCVRD